MDFRHGWRLLSALALIATCSFGATKPRVALASVSLTSLGTPYSQNFDTLANTGNSNQWYNDGAANQTIAGWVASRKEYIAGSGTGTSGGLYSFGATSAAERALGSIASTGTSTVYYGLRLTNNTGNLITGLDVAYTGEQWRAGDKTTPQSLMFSYQVAATTEITSGTYIPVPALNFTGPVQTGAGSALDGNTEKLPISGSISGLSVQPGQEILLRWADSNDDGSDSGLAIDDLSITASGEPAPAPNLCSTAVTGKIGSIQGTTDTSPPLNQSVVLSGTVVGDFQGSSGLNGFYIQDDGDGNTATSDGIFVFVPSSNTSWASFDVAAGESIQATGTVTDFQGLTELTTVTKIEKCGTGVNITPTVVNLPETTNGDLERYEGMLVNMPQTFTVQQNFFQGRYGQVTLGLGRLYQPTNLYRPGTPEAQALADANARSLFVLDDAKSSQNPNPIPYIGLDNTLRAGDTTSNLTGILDFGAINSNTTIRDYRLQPTAAVTFARSNPRTVAPENVGGNLKVASFNVLNYFNGDGQGGGFPTSRGASTAAEFQRQRNKEIAALTAMNADVIGLMEMENDGNGSSSAIQDLVNGLNGATSAGRYAFVAAPNPGSDEIKVELIYQLGRVTPVGDPVNNTDPVNNRNPLAQTFTLNATGEKFTVIVNHFKSKGSCPSNANDPNADKGDGQGCWNAQRVQQAQVLLNFIADRQSVSGDQDVVVIGDLNSYGKEDPVATLTNGGLVDQLAKRVRNPYSYVFDGLSGYLDHALTTPSLDERVTGVTEWHINADEPSVIDYNTEFKPQDLYTPTPYRASDHDPVLIGIELSSGPIIRSFYLPYVGK